MLVICMLSRVLLQWQTSVGEPQEGFFRVVYMFLYCDEDHQMVNADTFAKTHCRTCVHHLPATVRWTSSTDLDARLVSSRLMQRCSARATTKCNYSFYYLSCMKG